MLSKNGVIVLCSFISPFKEVRDELKEMIHNFHEVHISASLEVCENRDVKGLYAKARAGEIPNFTGIGQAYEKPECPSLDINTGIDTIEESTDKVISYLKKSGAI